MKIRFLLEDFRKDCREKEESTEGFLRIGKIAQKRDGPSLRPEKPFQWPKSEIRQWFGNKAMLNYKRL